MDHDFDDALHWYEDACKGILHAQNVQITSCFDTTLLCKLFCAFIINSANSDTFATCTIGDTHSSHSSADHTYLDKRSNRCANGITNQCADSYSRTNIAAAYCRADSRCAHCWAF